MHRSALHRSLRRIGIFKSASSSLRLSSFLQSSGAAPLSSAAAAAASLSGTALSVNGRHGPRSSGAALSTWTAPSTPSSSEAVAPYDQTIHHPHRFPSLIIGAHGMLQPVGSFAQAQAAYLDPDPAAVQQLAAAMRAANAGIVAHYYMDVELQGVLQAVQRELQPLSSTSSPSNSSALIGIADSLKMGDMAVDMVQHQGVTAVACLGVDFMSESVQAILRKNGHADIPVYRATHRAIGCSLAESAERDSYRVWLQREGQSARENQQHPLHVVYINTSLETKAVSNSIVPTITCTSSNVLATILQASAQIPNLKLLYGPDTYMGDNLITLLDTLLQASTGGEGWDDARIARELHPQHNRASLQRLRDSIVVYPSGNCIVHHMFGAAVVDTVRKHYYDNDCFITAHLEVPGEMFAMAMEKSLQDQGVVGSTSDILNFVSRKVQQAASAMPTSSPPESLSFTRPKRLQFILGTEAGMVTSIVQSVQKILANAGNPSVEAEIIFPVAQDAVLATDHAELPIVPGVAGGEGCSTAGGCATCPFMKMNSLDALLEVLDLVATTRAPLDAPPSSVISKAHAQLQRHLPPDRLSGKVIQGRPAMEWGSEPIVYMRAFMKDKRLPDDLVQRVTNRI